MMFPIVPHRQARRCRSLLAFAILLFGFAPSGHAHEIRPAVIDLSYTETGEARFEIQLNLEALIAQISPEHEDTDQSANAGQYNALRGMPPADLRQEFVDFQPRFLDGIMVRDQGGTRLDAEVASVSIDEVGDTDLARLSKVTVAVSPPPGTQSVSWSWDRQFGPGILRVIEPGKEDGYSVYLAEGDATDPIPVQGTLEQSGAAVFLNYLMIGFTHIVPKGLDHILFVVGLFLLSTKLKPLLIQVTSFTVAHSVTLALGVLGIVTLPASIVEPLIAASIVYVAVENIVSDKLQRWRPVVVFCFGLLHGLGFAGVLSEIGISENYFVTALASFNIGVELGQIAVILGCFLAVGLWFRYRSWYRSLVTIPASAVVALVGAYWFVERAFLS